MQLPEEGYLLCQARRFTNGLSSKQARDQGLAGATVLRGLMGFGANTRAIQTFKIERLSTDLPMAVEVIKKEKNSKPSWNS